MQLSLIQIARLAYAALSIYQAIRKARKEKSWDELGEAVQKEFIEFIKPIIKKPYVSPEILHSNWMDDLLKNGWKWGEKKDEKAKTHPSLISWANLPVEIQFKNILVQNIVQQLVALSQAKKQEYITKKFEENPDWQNSAEAQELIALKDEEQVPLGVPYDAFLSGFRHS